MPPELSAAGKTDLIFVGTLISFLFVIGIVSGVAFWIRHCRHAEISWRQRMRFLCKVPLPSLPVLILIAGLFLVHGLVILAAVFFRDALEGEWGFVLQSAAFHWFIIFYVIAWHAKGQWSWYQYFGLRLKALSHNVSRGVIAYLIAMPVIFASGYIYQIVLIKFGYEPAQQPIMNFLTGDIPIWTRIYGVLLAILVAPAGEELLFRGLILPVVSRKLGVPMAIVAVSMLFAAMHLFIPALVPLFFVSLACSYAYVYTGSLSTPIALHSMFNSVNLAFFFILHDILV